MPEVSIEIAGRTQRVGCGPGEEQHLIRLAGMIDAEASVLVQELGQMSEGRLMLLTALMLADKLVDAQTAMATAERKAANAQKLAQAQPAGSDMIGPEREAEIVRNLDALAERIGVLAGRLENSA